MLLSPLFPQIPQSPHFKGVVALPLTEKGFHNEHTTKPLPALSKRGPCGISPHPRALNLLISLNPQTGHFLPAHLSLLLRPELVTGSFACRARMGLALSEHLGFFQKALLDFSKRYFLYDPIHCLSSFLPSSLALQLHTRKGFLGVAKWCLPQILLSSCSPSSQRDILMLPSPSSDPALSSLARPFTTWPLLFLCTSCGCVNVQPAMTCGSKKIPQGLTALPRRMISAASHSTDLCW